MRKLENFNEAVYKCFVTEWNYCTQIYTFQRYSTNRPKKPVFQITISPLSFLLPDIYKLLHLSFSINQYFHHTKLV